MEEMILGKEKMSALNVPGEDAMLRQVGFTAKLRLLRLNFKTQKVLNLLADVQGYQIFAATVFQGDPHPGNILKLEEGRLGLIDYGQTKSISDKEKLAIARVVCAIGSGASASEIAAAMRDLGFRTKYDDDDILSKYAVLFFDSDIEGMKMGCPTPQSYFKALTDADPLVHVPDVAGKESEVDSYISFGLKTAKIFSCMAMQVFVARCSFILRGMGTMLGKQVHTSLRWKAYAEDALQSAKTAKRLGT
ncbi:MAG: hypothetical protein SGILL_003390 [Bacillariaceae sp.]